MAEPTALTADQRRSQTILETRTPEWRRERARKAGQAAQSPETLAYRLVKDWPELTAAQKHTVRVLLRPVIGKGS
jgi:xanthine/CO dehydrogenase XdhC/CoxF family maturation factor